MNGESGIGRTKMTRHIIVNDVHETGPGTNFRLCIALLRYQVGVSISTSQDTACGGHWMSGRSLRQHRAWRVSFGEDGAASASIHTMSNRPQITNTNKSHEQHKGAGQEAAIISIPHISYSVRRSGNGDSASQSRGQTWTQHYEAEPSEHRRNGSALRAEAR